jgi:hypothetical protein
MIQLEPIFNIIRGSPLPEDVRETLVRCTEDVKNAQEQALLNNTQMYVCAAQDKYKKLMGELTDASGRLDGANREMFLLSLQQIQQKSPTQPRPSRNHINMQLFEPGCSCGGNITRDEARCISICDVCGLSAEMFDLQIADTKIKRKPADLTNCKEADTLDKMLLMMQGIIPQDILRNEAEAQWERIYGQFLIQFLTPSLMQLSDTKTILKRLELRKFCKIAPYFHAKYTGIEPIKLSRGEIKDIETAYQTVLAFWKKSSIEGVKNLPHCGLIVYEIIQLSSWTPRRKIEVQNTIYHLEPTTVNNFRQTFWKIVCAGLGGIFVYRY